MHYKIDLRREDIFENPSKPLIFADFLNKNAELNKRIYEEVFDNAKLEKVI